MTSLAAIERPSQDPSAPTLIVLHGLGADEQDLMGLVPAVDPAWSVVAPRAPVRLPWGGFAWFPVEFLPDGTRRYQGEDAVRAAEAATRWLDDLHDTRPASPLVLAGFSQGAMIAWAVAQRARAPLAALWLMSGSVVPELALSPFPDLRMPILVQHGTEDEVLPIELGRAMQAHLRSHGLPHEYREYAMGHGISEQSLREGLHWVTERLNTQEPAVDAAKGG